jgi:hypothetical protein
MNEPERRRNEDRKKERLQAIISLRPRSSWIIPFFKFAGCVQNGLSCEFFFVFFLPSSSGGGGKMWGMDGSEWTREDGHNGSRAKAKKNQVRHIIQLVSDDIEAIKTDEQAGHFFRCVHPEAFYEQIAASNFTDPTRVTS